MSDAGQYEPRQPGGVPIPRIIELTVTRAPFAAPQLRHFESSLSEFDEAIEFHVRTDEPMPSSNLPILLYVGDVTLTEMRSTEHLQYVYYAFDEERLKIGAPITLALQNTPPEARGKAAYVYQGPGRS